MLLYTMRYSLFVLRSALFSNVILITFINRLLECYKPYANCLDHSTTTQHWAAAKTFYHDLTLSSKDIPPRPNIEWQQRHSTTTQHWAAKTFHHDPTLSSSKDIPPRSNIEWQQRHSTTIQHWAAAKTFQHDPTLGGSKGFIWYMIWWALLSSARGFYEAVKL